MTGNTTKPPRTGRVRSQRRCTATSRNADRHRPTSLNPEPDRPEPDAGSVLHPSIPFLKATDTR
jgi:hypothetical protein